MATTPLIARPSRLGSGREGDLEKVQHATPDDDAAQEDATTEPSPDNRLTTDLGPRRTLR